MKESTYVSKTPDENGLFTYTKEEDQIWADLYARQIETLKDHAAQIFWDGLDALGLPENRVPQVKEVSKTLKSRKSIAFIVFFVVSGHKKQE